MTQTSATQPAPTASRADKRRKAAVLVQMLMAEGLKLPLSSLPEDMQLALTREMGKLRLVDRDTISSVAAEFSGDLNRIAFSGPGSVDQALSELDGQISPAAAARLKEEQSSRKKRDPWLVLNTLNTEDLSAALELESTEVGAVVLSKLPVARAAEVLGALPGKKARKLAFAVSRTAKVTPAAVARIGAALAAQFGTKPPPTFTLPPDERVGAILNASPASTRVDVLSGLGELDAEFAELVRKAIFTFSDIPTRIASNDVPKIIRGVDGAVLVTALAAAQNTGGGEAKASDFILANMSQRMADQLREEIDERGKVKKVDGEKAMNDLVGTIRERADAGEITLIEIEIETEEE